MLFRRRTNSIIIVGIFLLWILFLFSIIARQDVKLISTNGLIHPEPEKVLQLKHEIQNDSPSDHINQSNVYNSLFQEYDIDVLLSLDSGQKCELYFKTLYSLDPNWNFDPNDKLSLKGFNSPEFNQFRKEKGKSKSLKSIQAEFSQTQLEENQQKVRDILSNFRIFNKCYIGTTSTNQLSWHPKSWLASLFEEKSTQSFLKGTHTFEKRFYPWLSGESPTYEDWSGVVHFDVPYSASPYNNPYWLNRFQNKFKGRGIVLTIGNQHVDSLIRLIRVLRALKNQYPIQIFVDEDFSQEAKDKIVDAARSNFTELPPSFDKVFDILGEDYINPEKGLPPQDIWFVNIKNTIVPSYWSLFKGFNKKLLANIFNSFEEYMLLDSDSVILENPEFFFNIKEYKQTGAYFFKDRSWDNRTQSSINFFKSLGPCLIDSVIFDIPMMTNHTLNREFFKGFKHYMESGLVLMDKKRHFNSILMMLQLSFFEPVDKNVYGEKEYFWLGMAFNGDESYEFEPNFAAAIGNFTDTNNSIKEVCSAHPAHLSAHDGHLLWINSGFQFCHRDDKGIIDYKTEASHGDRFSSDPDKLKIFYESLLRPNNGIIPPISLESTSSNGPTSGWSQDFRYCARKLYCAHSSIGNKDKPILGQVITFNDTSKNLMTYFGEIWMG
ncbi:uncharacterized protein SPAPADRAFT_50814 [Spathaspora passalidarum NRRL Y-27907]|uniref:Alpha-1,3-mannosyltransferase n=1 Tax=Spathaspora passalidarum (strain NRRL Y-27907 / 11-Y1) TaxID=619300 RepID=G3APS3_SPAPN|nr:uncharacterized protein SPAPADRAFT_50814 [Spathaspora passalidarum NRRL Y-27907]EGW32244.1 hypothetical protein SPAPADRAFT_50814 [Spathaspora passalidarum NRRL Y-27907]